MHVPFSYIHKPQHILSDLKIRGARPEGDLDLETRFIKMYVNDLSVDFGEQGRKALDLYYRKAVEMGLIEKFQLEIV